MVIVVVYLNNCTNFDNCTNIAIYTLTFQYNSFFN